MNQLADQRKNLIKSLQYLGIQVNPAAERRPSPATEGSQELTLGVLEAALVAGLFPNIARVCQLRYV